jgi:hypothetical protein
MVDRLVSSSRCRDSDDGEVASWSRLRQLAKDVDDKDCTSAGSDTYSGAKVRRESTSAGYFE